MKRLMTLFFSLFLFAFAGIAQVTVGYTNGKFDRGDGIRCGSTLQQGVAIKLSKEKLQLLQGRRITGIRAAFCTKFIDKLTFFVTESLGGEALYTQSASDAVTKWKEFNFDSPYTIAAGNDLYIGFTLESEQTRAPLAFDRSSDSKGLSWIYEDGNWVDAYGKGYGLPCFQLLLDGINDFTDLTLKTFQLDGYYKAGTAYVYNGEVFNFGTQTINSFNVTCQIGDGAPVVLPISGINVESNQSYNFSLPEYMSPDHGDLPVKVSITNINGAPQDADLTDNVSESEAYIYPTATEKRLLLENFTGQDCGNCPEGHRTIESIVKGHEDEIISMAHHAGYQPDAFTMKEDWEYCLFYNQGGSIYAPALMINRMQNPDLGTPGPVFGVGEKQIINTINRFMEIQPYVSIDINSEFNEETKQLKAKVSVYTHVVPESDRYILNLFIIQDSIIAYQSNGGAEYVHNHVCRGALTGIWGYEISLKKGMRIEKEFTYTLPEAIMSSYDGKNSASESIPTVLKDMHLIAFVSAYSETSPNGCYVLNSNKTTFGGNTSGSGIEEIQMKDDFAEVYVVGKDVYLKGAYDKADVYDMTGKLVKTVDGNEDSFALNEGFYVIRMMHKGKVVSRKLMVCE